MVKVGSTWQIKNYAIFNIKDGKIVKTNGEFCEYKVTDIRKTNTKGYFVVSMKISWTWLGVEATEYAIGNYNHKYRTFSLVEPAIPTLAEPVGFENLRILKNGKLRVKYLDENNTAIVMDLSKTA
jgi:hypothetical protein